MGFFSAMLWRTWSISIAPAILSTVRKAMSIPASTHGFCRNTTRWTRRKRHCRHCSQQPRRARCESKPQSSTKLNDLADRAASTTQNDMCLKVFAGCNGKTALDDMCMQVVTAALHRITKETRVTKTNQTVAQHRTRNVRKSYPGTAHKHPVQRTQPHCTERHFRKSSQ